MVVDMAVDDKESPWQMIYVYARVYKSAGESVRVNYCRNGSIISHGYKKEAFKRGTHTFVYV